MAEKLDKKYLIYLRGHSATEKITVARILEKEPGWNFLDRTDGIFHLRFSSDINW